MKKVLTTQEKEEVKNELNAISVKEQDEYMVDINIWSKELKFSIITLLFFIFLSVISMFSPYYAIYLSILFSAVSLFFITRTIRAIQYLKFHKKYYRMSCSVQRQFEEIINLDEYEIKD